MSGEASAHLARARSIGGADDARAVYRDWAEVYERDVYGTLGFVGTRRIVELLADNIDWRNRPVLDLGCGTGAAGVHLGGHGFVHVDGVDLSPEMLTVARSKNIYRRLEVADLTEALPIATASYSAAVSAGTFTGGHVGPEALPEVWRVLEPGGYLACVIGSAMIDAFGPALADAPLRIIHDRLEPIRAGGPPQGRFVVAERL